MTEYFVSLRAVWPEKIEKIGFAGLGVAFVIAVVTLIVFLFNPTLAGQLGVAAVVLLGLSAALMGVGVVAEMRDERHRLAQARVFLETRYQNQYFSPRAVARFALGVGIPVLDNGLTKQRISLGAMTAQGQPLMSKTEPTSRLGTRILGAS